MDVKLNAMNYMLAQAKGVRPISSVSNGHPFAVQARTILENLDYETQNKGWYFNKEYNVLFTPDNEGAIIIPDAVLQARFSANARYKLSRQMAMQYTIRGHKVWDGVARSANVGRPMYLDIITQLPMNDCPVSYIAWLTRLATLDLYTAGPTEAAKLQKLQTDVNRAWVAFYEDILRNSETNGLNTPIGSAMTSWTNTSYNPNGLIGNL